MSSHRRAIALIGALALAAPFALAAPAAQAATTTDPAKVGMYGAPDRPFLEFDAVFVHSLAVLGLVASGGTPAPEAVDWLTAQQCPDGGFAAFRTPVGAPCPATDLGAFTGEDSNSTAVAAMALRAVGQDGRGPAGRGVAGRPAGRDERLVVPAGVRKRPQLHRAGPDGPRHRGGLPCPERRRVRRCRPRGLRRTRGGSGRHHLALQRRRPRPDRHRAGGARLRRGHAAAGAHRRPGPSTPRRCSARRGRRPTPSRSRATRRRGWRPSRLRAPSTGPTPAGPSSACARCLPGARRPTPCTPPSSPPRWARPTRGWWA